MPPFLQRQDINRDLIMASFREPRIVHFCMIRVQLLPVTSKVKYRCLAAFGQIQPAIQRRMCILVRTSSVALAMVASPAEGVRRQTIVCNS